MWSVLREANSRLDEWGDPLMAAGDMLQAWRNAKEIGGTTAYLAAAATTLGKLSESLDDVLARQARLHREKYTRLSDDLADALTKWLPAPASKFGIECFWVDDTGQAAFYGVQDENYNEIRIADLSAARRVLAMTWRDSQWIEISAKTRGRGHAVNLTYRNIPVRQNFGHYLDDVHSVLRSDVQVAAIIGPTGNGKTSTLASLLRGKKMLSIKWGRLSPEDYVQAADLLQPEVIIVDDAPFKETFDAEFAQLLDDLRGLNIKVLLTFMADNLPGQTKPGDLYWPGLRPGRIDEMIVLTAPDLADREEILLHAGLSPDAARGAAFLTEGLTGAYLNEIARRVLGGRPLAEAVKLIRAQAPASFTREPFARERPAESDPEPDE